jgi:hypothetical protein
MTLDTLQNDFFSFHVKNIKNIAFFNVMSF